MGKHANNPNSKINFNYKRRNLEDKRWKISIRSKRKCQPTTKKSKKRLEKWKNLDYTKKVLIKYIELEMTK
jgi:hypothetical protein